MRFFSAMVLAIFCTSAASSALPGADSIETRAREFGVVDAQDGIRLSERHGGEEHEHEFVPPVHSAALEHAHGGASNSSTPSLTKQSAHQHAHGPPQAHINETLILTTHDPDPLAYWRYGQENDAAYPALLLLHIALASVLLCSAADQLSRLHEGLSGSAEGYRELTESFDSQLPQGRQISSGHPPSSTCRMGSSSLEGSRPLVFGVAQYRLMFQRFLQAVRGHAGGVGDKSKRSPSYLAGLSRALEGL